MSNHRGLFMQGILLFVFGILLFGTSASATTPAIDNINNPATIAHSANPVTDTTTDTERDPASIDDTHSPSDQPLAERNYTALHDAIPRYEAAVANPWPIIPDGLYKLHARGHNIVMLRSRLNASGDLPQYANVNDPLFDRELLQAVENFQQRHGLQADGVVGEKTISQLNVPASVRLNQLQVNLKRWADLEPRMHDRFIMVNVPDFQLHAYDNDMEVLTLKAIVGKTTRQTPELSSKVTRLVFNPYWNVPQMIAKKDIAPKVLDNPEYLRDEHIRIFDGDEDDSRQISQDDVNWEDAAENGVPYHLRQDPGNKNALGLIKFEFQNSADVYLHDTPAKELFAENVRTFSSGCIRLENPFALVTYLMQADDQWSDDRMQGILDTQKTTYVRAATPTPIFITYITAWVDETGNINFRDDVYGRDTPGQDSNGQNQPQDSDEDSDDNPDAYN